MDTFLLIILLVVTAIMIGVILLQRSEGGGLGIGSGNMGGMMTNRGTKNLLTRTTAILATIFMALCLLLAILSGYSTKHNSILKTIAVEEEVNTAVLEGQTEAPQPALGEEKNAAVAEVPVV